MPGIFPRKITEDPDQTKFTQTDFESDNEGTINSSFKESKEDFVDILPKTSEDTTQTAENIAKPKNQAEEIDIHGFVKVSSSQELDTQITMTTPKISQVAFDKFNLVYAFSSISIATITFMILPFYFQTKSLSKFTPYSFIFGACSLLCISNVLLVKGIRFSNLTKNYENYEKKCGISLFIYRIGLNFSEILKRCLQNKKLVGFGLVFNGFWT